MKKLYTILFVSGMLLSLNNKAQTTTYNDVANIFYKHCTGCHHTGGMAPMPLMNYNDCGSFSTSIQTDLNSGKMPPWQPDTTYTRFIHEAAIPKAEKDLILKWINDGLVQGDPNLAPTPPVYDDYKYKLCPEPDMVLKINGGQPYTLAHDEGYDCFVVQTNLPAERYLRAYEIVPGNAEIVHHVVIAAGSGFVGSTSGGCAIAGGAGVEMGTYVPNTAPTVWPDQTQLRCGMKFAANTELNLQIHYAPGCQGKTDNLTEVRLYFYPEGATNIREVHTTVDIEKVVFGQAVGANQQGYDSASYAVNSARSILGIFPHAHLVCDKIFVHARANGQPTVPLIRIPKWYFDWAGYFFYKKLVKVPSGYNIWATNHYNNTSSNPDAPNTNQPVQYGTSTNQEMLYQAFQWMDYVAGDENIDMEALLKCDTLLVCNPKGAGAITGATSFCGAQTAVTYSVAAIPNADTYVWAYSGTGATITGNGNSVTVDFAANATSGNLTVKGANECNNYGAISPNKAITISGGGSVAAAGTITGSSSVCSSQSGVSYSVGSISGASGYAWSYSGTGATINGSGTSVTINFASNATSGDLTVKGTGACGDGALSPAFAITVNALPSTPTISVVNNCGNSVLTSSSATGNTWSPNNETTQSITVTTGGTYSVTVGSGGCSATSAGEVVNITPSPSITGITAASRCGAGTVTLGATASSGTITWYDALTGGTSLGTGTSYTTPSISSTTTYYVDATGSGCTSTPRTAVIATVSNGATATISGNATVCTGATGVLSIALTGTAPFGFTYGSASGSNPVSNITSSTYTVAAVAGTYTVGSVSDGSGCTGTGSGSATITENTAVTVSNITTACSGGNYTVEFDISGGDVASYAVTGGAGSLTTNTHYTSGPIVSGTAYSFSVTDAANCAPVAVNGSINCGCSATAAISGGGTICNGNAATISVALSGGSTFDFTYAIDGVSQPAVTGITSSPYTFTTTTSGAYTLVSVTDGTCTGSTSGTASVSQTTPTATLSGGGAFCPGGSTNLSFDLTAGSPPWSVTYSDGTTSSTVTSSAVNKLVSVSTAGTYTIVSMSAGSCNGTGSGSAIVTVHTLPSVGATVSPSATVCSGTSVTLNGTGASTYTWSDGKVDGQAFTVTADHTYTVTGTDANSCSNTATQSITVNALPTITTVANPSSAAVCTGGSITLSGSGSSTSYTWTGPVAVQDGVSFVATAGTYVVTGTDANNCTNTATRAVSVLALPTVGVTVNPSEASVCVGGSVTLSGTGATSYSWSGGVTDGVAFVPTTLGATTYTVTGTLNSCINTATQVVTVNTCTVTGGGVGIQESSTQQITVYPNPTSGTFNISISHANFKELSISVVNMLGKEVFTATDKNNSTDYHVQVNLESLPKGMYYLKLSTATETKITKLTIQ